MGQANRRGAFEQRKAHATQQRDGVMLEVEMSRRLRYHQECAAYDTMVWWQIEMSEQRNDHITMKRTGMQMKMAQLLGMAFVAGWEPLAKFTVSIKE